MQKREEIIGVEIMGGQFLRISKSGGGGLWPSLPIDAVALGPKCYIIGEFTEYRGPYASL